MRNLKKIDEEYEEIRAGLDADEQAIAPISDYGVQFDLSFKKNLVRQLPSYISDKVFFARVFQTPHFLMELEIFNQTGGLAVGLDNNLVAIPYPARAVAAWNSSRQEDGTSLRGRYYGVLHQGFEEIEMALIQNRADFVRHINRELEFFMKLLRVPFGE